MIVLLSGFLAAGAALFGYETVACKSALAGALATIMRAGFLIHVDTKSLVGALALLGAFLWLSHLGAHMAFLRRRQALLPVMATILALVGGLALGVLLETHIRCALHPWR